MSSPYLHVVTTRLLPPPLGQGGALLNIRDALGIGDWAAEAIVAAAKFGAVVRTCHVILLCLAVWLAWLLPCSHTSKEWAGCLPILLPARRSVCLLNQTCTCLPAALLSCPPPSSPIWQPGTFLGGALMLHYGRRAAIGIDSLFFIVGPLIMALALGVG